jgi:hypothetical protein
LHKNCLKNTYKQSTCVRRRVQGCDRDFASIREKQIARAHRAELAPIAHDHANIAALDADQDADALVL